MKIGFRELNKINKHLNKYLKKSGKEIGKFIDKYGKDISKIVVEEGGKIIEYLKEKASDIDEAIDNAGGLENVLKTLWNTEEEVVDVLTLEMMISWCKQNLSSDTERARAVILLLKPTQFPDDSKLDDCRFCCFVGFLDNNDDIIDSKMKYFYSDTMDLNLKETFGDKDMIILK